MVLKRIDGNADDEKPQDVRMQKINFIAEQFRIHRALSLKEISEKWIEHVDISDGVPIHRNTFRKYCKTLETVYGFVLEYNERTHKYVLIRADADERITNEILASAKHQSLLKKMRQVSDRVILEPIPEGVELADRIADAMISNHKVSFLFKNFDDDETWEVTGCPYCLKLYQQRWYVVLKDDEEYIDTYSLDRLVRLDELDEVFVMDRGFDAERFFQHSMGVRVSQGDMPVRVVIKVKKAQCGYVDTLPLHSSQRCLEEHDDYNIYELTVLPTVEFFIKIASLRTLVEILEPQYIRDEFRYGAEILYKMYSK